MHLQKPHGGIAFVWQAIANHHIHENAVCIDIGSIVDIGTIALFGAHELGRADDEAVFRLSIDGFVEHFGNAKIEDFDRKSPGNGFHEHDIFGFEVAMNDSGFVDTAKGMNHRCTVPRASAICNDMSTI